MGACASCLGLNRRPSPDEDASRLLFDDEHSNPYGTFNDQSPGVNHADPQEVQRETEALQKVVAQTSNHLVDIFAVVPQNLHGPAGAFSGQHARLMQYRDVLAKLPNADVLQSDGTILPSGAFDESDYVSDAENDEGDKSYTVVKAPEIGPLLGGFADIERRRVK